MSETIAAVPGELLQWRAQFPILASSTYLVSHSMGAAPLGARSALESYWDEWSADGPEAWERWLPRIAEIADGIGTIIGARAGTCFLGAERLGAPGGGCNLHRLQLRTATRSSTRPCSFHRSRTCGANGSAMERSLRVVDLRSGRTIPTDRIVEAITEKTAIAVLSHAYYVSGAIADVRAIQAHCRAVGALLCVDAYQTTGVYPYDVTAWDLDLVTGGSHKWLCGASGLRLDLSSSRRFLKSSVQPSPAGWLTRAPSRSSPRRSRMLRRCTDSAMALRRFPDTWLRSLAMRSSHRSVWRAFANATWLSPTRLSGWHSSVACASTLRCKPNGEPDGLVSTSTVPSERVAG